MRQLGPAATPECGLTLLTTSISTSVKPLDPFHSWNGHGFHSGHSLIGELMEAYYHRHSLSIPNLTAQLSLGLPSDDANSFVARPVNLQASDETPLGLSFEAVKEERQKKSINLELFSVVQTQTYSGNHPLILPLLMATQHYGGDEGYYSDGSAGGSSAPNSEDEFIDDGERGDIELQRFEDDDFLAPIPIILRLTPPIMRQGPPVLEVWGARAFGYVGDTVVWSCYRAEPESDEISDDANFWRPLGIRVDVNEYHRAFLVRRNPQTMNRPPQAPQHERIPYAQQQVQQVPGALLVKTFGYDPAFPDMGNGVHPVGTYWLVGCGKITDRKDLKRVRLKVDLYITEVKGRQRPIAYF